MIVLNTQDRELVRNVGPATPIGERLRRYWHPVLLSGDLPEPDGRPLRVRVLVEDLVAFRDSEGRVGLVEEACPHRGLPLANGINANGRLTCIYHGWAFDVTGRCVDDLPDADQWRVKAYPTVESAGMIWAYLGPPDTQPPPPNYIFNQLPPEQVVAMLTPVRRNYLAVIEEQIAAAGQGATSHANEIELQDTGCGLRLVAAQRGGGEPRRDDVAAHVLPGLTVATASGACATALIAVPVDEWSSLRFAVAFRSDRAFSVTERQAITGQNAEAAGDHPGSPDHGSAGTDVHPTDAAIARSRHMLVTCAYNLQQGIDPPAANANGATFHLRL